MRHLYEHLTEGRFRILFSLIALVLAVSLFSSFQAMEAKSVLGRQAVLPEALAPVPLPIIQVVKLTSAQCADCWNPDGIANALLASANASIQAVGAETPQGRALAQKYALTRVPTVVVSGEVGDVRLAQVFAKGWRQSGGAQVFMAQQPVFFNPLTSEFTGRVTLTRVVDETCKLCADLSPVAGQLRKGGVSITAEVTMNASSPEGAELVKKYSPATLPFLVLSKDAGAYEQLAAAWKSLGSIEPDGAFVTRLAVPPFRNLTSGRIDGLVSLVELTDKSCKACYDVTTHEKILASMGVAFGNISVLDIGSAQGKALAAKYNVTQVPTVILSSDAWIYPAIANVWEQVGTKEPDGQYVFRKMEALGNVTVATVPVAKG